MEIGREGSSSSFTKKKKFFLIFNTREYLDEKDVMNTCRLFWIRLLSSWRNTLYPLIFAFPSFPLLFLVAAKGHVQLNTQQIQTTVPQDIDLQETRVGSGSNCSISMGNRYLKSLYPQQNQYTPQVIQ